MATATEHGRARTERPPPRASVLERAAPVAGALAVLALFVVLRVARLDQTPGVDAQEGYTLDTAWNLLHGQWRLFALTSAFAQHPPLFTLQVALAIRVFGYGLLAVRAVAVLWSVLACAALLVVGRRLVGTGAALLAGVVFAVAPILLDNTRWGYSYAQVMCVGLLCLGAAWRFVEADRTREDADAPLAQDGTGWLVAAAALAGVAVVSDYMGVAWVLFVAGVALRRSWRWALAVAGIAAGVVVAVLLPVVLASPGVFFADALATAGRAGGGNPLLQVLTLLLNEYRFLVVDPWFVLGVVGLFLLPGRSRGVVVGAVATLALVVFKVRDVGPNLHAALPLLPFVALGSGVALARAIGALRGWTLALAADGIARWHLPVAPGGTAARALAAVVVFAALVSPLGIALASDAAGVAGSLPTRQDNVLGSPSDGEATAAWVLAHAHDGDLVLASPTLAWRFDAPEGSGLPRTAGADILQSVAQSGSSAAFYPAKLPADRWAYDVSPNRARYIVDDDLLRALATPDQEPQLAALMSHVRATWPVVHRQGQYTVYERPLSS